MEPLAISIASERRRLFVGRTAELSALDTWLGQPDPPTRLFHVTGMGGIGKSTLLRRMFERARAERVPGLWIDGRASSATPAGFLAYLAVMLDFPGRLTLDQIRAGALAHRLNRRTIWCMDNYDALEPLHEWLWEAFFPELPERGHLLVLASRGVSTAIWRTDPGWRSRVHHLPLEPWTPAESAEYLRRVGIPEGRIGSLIRATGGQPLALALAADAFGTRAQALEEATLEATREVSASLMREAAGTRLEPWLEVLAVVPAADRALFRQVADEPPSDEQLLALGRLSFVQPAGAGFRLHDVARQHLLAELRERDPDRFRVLRRRAVHALIARLDSAHRKARRDIAAALLTISADMLPSVESYATLNHSEVGRVRSVIPGDLPHLHRLIDEWGLQPFIFPEQADYHRVLNWWADHFPHWVRVVQDGQGNPLAFFAFVLVHQETTALLDRLAPGAVAMNHPGEGDQWANLGVDEADTYVALMTGVTDQSPAMSPEILVGSLMRDALAHLGEGARAFSRISHPDLRRLVLGLGFHQVPEAQAGPGYPPLPGHLYELDLRDGRFGPWLLSFLLKTEGEVMPARAVSAAGLRELLRGWYEATTWGDSNPLFSRLGCDGRSFQRRLEQILSGQHPLPPPFSHDDRKLLLETYIHQRPAERVARQLHISRATYYRHLARALERLAAALAASR